MSSYLVNYNLQQGEAMMNVDTQFATSKKQVLNSVFTKLKILHIHKNAASRPRGNGTRLSLPFSDNSGL